MKILILSQWCYPEPDLKALTFAKALANKGHNIQILTGFPNYPGGKVYSGYKVRLFRTESIDGIEILRCALFPSHDRSAIKRILNYLSFALSASLIGLFKASKADVMYVYHPPATVAIPAILIKFFRRIPVVYDIQDIWPDTLRATGMLSNKIVLRIIDWYMKMCYRFFDHITVLSNGFKELLIKRGVKPLKITVIHNWSNPLELPSFTTQTDKQKVFGEKFTVLFAGTIGLAQGLDVVINAAEHFMKENIHDLQFVLLGDGTDVHRLKQIAASRNLDNVAFLGRVSNKEVGKYLALADVLLIHLIKESLFEITVPSKTQAYLLAGKPILVGVEGDASRLVENAKAGYSFNPEDEIDLVNKVKLLRKASSEELTVFGENAEVFYNEHLSIEKGVGKFEKIFLRFS